MNVYIIAIAIILTMLGVTAKYKSLNQKALFVSFMILWLISGFRASSVGTDTAAYVHYFSAVQDGSIDVLKQIRLPNIFVFEGFENGYQLYNLILTHLISTYTGYFLITYGFIYYSFYRFIKRFSSDYMLSMVIYITLFFFGSMSYMRQSLAMAIVTWGMIFIVERKLTKYLFIVFLATLIHQASLLMLIPYFMYGKKISHRNMIVYAFVAISIFLLVDKIVYFMADFNPRYSFYVDRINSYSMGSLLSFITIALISFFFYRLYLRYSKLKTSDQKTVMEQVFYLKMMLMSTLFSLVAIKVNALSRIADYFMVFSIISIPNIFVSNKNAHLINFYKILFMCLLFIYCFSVLILRPEWFTVSSYQLVWGGM